MEVFNGAQLRPPRVSLLSAADLITVDNERWSNGFQLVEEDCEVVNIYAVCAPTDADPKDADTFGNIIDYLPYVLYTGVRCSTFSRNIDFYDRAQRKLLTGESTALEEILWTGFLGGVDVSTNPFLADAPQTITATASSPEESLAVLEQHMGEASANQGMIHLRPQVLGQLLDHKIIRREGNIYLSPMDNIVVPGRGYPGTGPAGELVGASEWMYGHPGIVQVRRGPVVRLGEDDTASQYIRNTNDRIVIVERVAHVALDNTCGVFAIEFDSIE